MQRVHRARPRARYHDFAAAELHPGGDRLGAGKPSETDHRQPIDLPYLSAISLDADCLAPDFFLQTPIDRSPRRNCASIAA